MATKLAVTLKNYTDMILLMYNAGLENATEIYLNAYGHKFGGHGDSFISTCAEYDFNHPIHGELLYNDLIEQIAINDYGSGVMIDRQQAKQVLDSGPLNKLTIHGKAYSGDWIKVDEDFAENCLSRFTTFVLNDDITDPPTEKPSLTEYFLIGSSSVFDLGAYPSRKAAIASNYCNAMGGSAGSFIVCRAEAHEVMRQLTKKLSRYDNSMFKQ